MLLTAVGAGQFEGNCLIPALFANTRRQRDFGRMISYSIILVFCYIMFSAPIAVLAFGDAIQEISLESDRKFLIPKLCKKLPNLKNLR